MSNNLGTLTLDLVAQMGGWVDGFTQAERATKAETRKMQRSIKEVEKSVKSMGDTLRNVAGLIGLTLTVSAFDNWIRGSVQAAASAGVFAEKIGLTTEELTTFRYIAVQTGSDIQSLDSSMLRLNSRLGAAVSGGGPAANTLKNLGLNAKELLKLPLEERILAISKAMDGLSRGEQLRSLQNMAGDSARGLINMFQLSKEEITDLTNRAERLGYVYSTEMARSADVVMGKIDEMKGAFGNLSLQILTEFLPDIEEYLNSISLENIEEHMETARAVVDNLGVAIQALGYAFSAGLAGKVAISTIAFGVNTVAQIANAAAAKRVEGASKMAALAIGTKTIAVNGLRVALGALGGPLGIAILTALSFITLKKSQDETKKSSDELASSLSGLEQDLRKLTGAQIASQTASRMDVISSLEEDIESFKKTIKEANEEIEYIEKQLTNPHISDDGFQRATANLTSLKRTVIDSQAAIDTATEKINQQYFAVGNLGLAYESTKKDVDNFNYSLSESLNKTLDDIKEQTARMGLKTKVEIFRHELEYTDKWDTYKGDGEEQRAARARIEAEFAKQDAMQASLRTATKSIDIAAEYRRVMGGIVTDEERRGQELTKNLDILKQYGASEEDMLAVRRAAYESMSSDIPDMGEGGNTLTAQLARIGENMAQLDAWRDEQLMKLELAYGNEENALAESLEKREEMERQYRERREQFEGEMNQELINLGTNLTSESLSALRDAGLESSGIYKAMFLANKASAFANAIISSQEAGAKALAVMPGPAGIALSKTMTTMGMINAGIIAATGLKGMAHSGIDKVPETGTWLLEKGERVVTSNTSAKLDATLENLRNQNAVNSGGDVYSSINVTINSDGEVESESEANGNAFANLVKKMVVDIISREMKPGGTLAKR